MAVRNTIKGDAGSINTFTGLFRSTEQLFVCLRCNTWCDHRRLHVRVYAHIEVLFFSSQRNRQIIHSIAESGTFYFQLHTHRSLHLQCVHAPYIFGIIFSHCERRGQYICREFSRKPRRAGASFGSERWRRGWTADARRR